MAIYKKLDVSDILIDLIVFVIDVPEAIRDEVVSNIQLLNGIKKEPVANYSHVYNIPVATEFNDTYLDSGNDISYLRLEYGPKQVGAAFLRVSMYPTVINMKLVHKNLEKVLAPMSIPLPTVLLTSKITQLDLAVDIKGIHIDELMFKANKFKYYENIVSESKTLYIGNRRSSSAWFCIYDKAYKLAKLSKSKLVKTKVPITRIEFKQRGQKIPCLKNLKHSRNPFKKIELYYFPFLSKKDVSFNLVIALAKYEGIKNAVGRLSNEGEIKRVNDYIKQGKIINWSAQKYWKTVSKAIDSIIIK